MTSKVYVDHGINWVWYCHATIIEDGTATVDREYRVHKGDDGHPPHCGAGYQMIEHKGEWGKPRVVHSIRLGNETYPLAGGDAGRWDFHK